MSHPCAAKSLALYRAFLRLRRMFPARSARTQLRLTTIALFRSRRAVYQDTVASRGIAVANSLAEGSYKEALEDYKLWKELSQQPESVKRLLTGKKSIEPYSSAVQSMDSRTEHSSLARALQEYADAALDR